MRRSGCCAGGGRRRSVSRGAGASRTRSREVRCQRPALRPYFWAGSRTGNRRGGRRRRPRGRSRGTAAVPRPTGRGRPGRPRGRRHRTGRHHPRVRPPQPARAPPTGPRFAQGAERRPDRFPGDPDGREPASCGTEHGTDRERRSRRSGAAAGGQGRLARAGEACRTTARGRSEEGADRDRTRTPVATGSHGCGARGRVGSAGGRRATGPGAVPYGWPGTLRKGRGRRTWPRGGPGRRARAAGGAVPGGPAPDAMTPGSGTPARGTPPYGSVSLSGPGPARHSRCGSPCPTPPTTETTSTNSSPTRARGDR